MKYANAAKSTTNLGNVFNSSVKEISRDTYNEKLMEHFSKKSKKQKHKKKDQWVLVENLKHRQVKSLVGSKTNESSPVSVELKKDTWDLYVGNPGRHVCE